MRRILITAAYDGTDFHGFAYQAGVRTVEGALADAVCDVTGTRAEITGASRTDAGVHAYGNLASFDTDSTIPAERFPYALNQALPADVRVICAEETGPAFHPRKTGWPKTYEYRILNTPWPDPVQRRYTYHYRTPLDAEAMNTAAAALAGEHDFTSFCSVHSLSPTRVRTIFDCGVTVREAYTGCGPSVLPFQTNGSANEDLSGRLVVIRVTGSGFLYHMVRIIAGTLLDVGRGRTKPEEIRSVLEARDRACAGTTLEPQGLFLMRYHRDEQTTGNGHAS